LFRLSEADPIVKTSDPENKIELEPGNNTGA